MILQPFFDPESAGRPMRVAAFMSGSGTNIRRLLERERALKAKAGESPGGNRIPVSSSSIRSTIPPVLDATQGLPAAMASSSALPIPSLRDGRMKISRSLRKPPT